MATNFSFSFQYFVRNIDIINTRQCLKGKDSCMFTQIAKFMGPTWGPPGSCRHQMGPMWAPWTLLSGYLYRKNIYLAIDSGRRSWNEAPGRFMKWTIWECHGVPYCTPCFYVDPIQTPWISCLHRDLRWNAELTAPMIQVKRRSSQYQGRACRDHISITPDDARWLPITHSIQDQITFSTSKLIFYKKYNSLISGGNNFSHLISHVI